MTDTPYDAAMTRSKQELARQLVDANARIEALEFEVEHERHNVEKTAQEAAKRIKALEAALRCADQFITNGIELGYIRMPDAGTPDSAHKTPGIIRAALDQSSPPKAGT